MKNLYVTIAGQVGTGKTMLMLMFEQFLIDKGFNVELDLENELLDYGSEGKMRQVFIDNYARQIVGMKKNVKINIKQVQLPYEITETEENNSTENQE